MNYYFTKFNDALRTLITLLGMLETFTYIAYMNALNKYCASKSEQELNNLKTTIGILHGDILSNYSLDDNDDDDRKNAFNTYIKEYEAVMENNEDNDNQDGMDVDMGQEKDDSTASTGESLPPPKDNKNDTTRPGKELNSPCLLEIYLNCLDRLLILLIIDASFIDWLEYGNSNEYIREYDHVINEKEAENIVRRMSNVEKGHKFKVLARKCGFTDDEAYDLLLLSLITAKK